MGFGEGSRAKETTAGKVTKREGGEGAGDISVEVGRRGGGEEAGFGGE